MNVYNRFKNLYDLIPDSRVQLVHLFREGLGYLEIYKQLESKYRDILDNPKNLARYLFTPLFALTLWNYGIYDKEIFKQAIIGISSDNVLSADFSEYNPYNGRIDLGWPDQRLPLHEDLMAIKLLLLSPNNKPTQLRIKKHYKCPWKIGDILVYQNTDSKLFCAIVKIKETEIYPEQFNAQVLFFEWASHDLPSEEDFFDGVGILRDEKFMHNENHVLTTIMVDAQKNKYIKKFKKFSTMNEKRLQKLRFSELKTNMYIANRDLNLYWISSLEL